MDPVGAEKARKESPGAQKEIAKGIWGNARGDPASG
jgi:hypothetical protein